MKSTETDLRPKSPQELPLEVRNLCKHYKNGPWANQDISLTVQPGEIVGILGPNGAGKTTLVRQVTTELLPTSGDVRVLGWDVAAQPTHVKSLLGIVPQDSFLYTYLNVFQHLRIFGKLRGLGHRDSILRAEELIEELRLTEYRKFRVGNLSGGLRRRMLVGIAILAQPPLMVLDEPTTGLDPESRQNLWAVLRRHRERGSSVLLTTHYMEEAETLCDRVGIIQEGKLVAMDTVANLRAAHGYESKITYLPDGSNGEMVTIYGSDSQKLVEQVQAKGITQFSLAQTNLEDVYMSLTGAQERLDDGSP